MWTRVFGSSASSSERSAASRFAVAELRSAGQPRAAVPTWSRDKKKGEPKLPRTEATEAISLIKTHPV